MRLLALGGSLREASRTRALLHEAAALAPAGTKLDLSHVAIVGSLQLYLDFVNIFIYLLRILGDRRS